MRESSTQTPRVTTYLMIEVGSDIIAKRLSRRFFLPQEDFIVEKSSSSKSACRVEQTFVVLHSIQKYSRTAPSYTQQNKI